MTENYIHYSVDNMGFKKSKMTKEEAKANARKYYYEQKEEYARLEAILENYNESVTNGSANREFKEIVSINNQLDGMEKRIADYAKLFKKYFKENIK